MKFYKYILSIFSILIMILAIRYTCYMAGICGLILAWQMGSIWGTNLIINNNNNNNNNNDIK